MPDSTTIKKHTEYDTNWMKLVVLSRTVSLTVGTGTNVWTITNATPTANAKAITTKYSIPLQQKQPSLVRPFQMQTSNPK